MATAARANARTCSNCTSPNHQVFHSPIDLPVLQVHLHGNYIPSNRSHQIAYRAGQSFAGWIVRAINPTGKGMVGLRALVAFQNSDGIMDTFSAPITNYTPSMQPGVHSFHVSHISATYANNEMTIFAVLRPLQNATSLNHVWQAGSVSNCNQRVLGTSEPNIQSTG